MATPLRVGLSNAPTDRPLTGVRVVELGSLIAGPFAGRLLADFGAEVIKVEDPGRPDPLREWGNARHRDRTLWWPVQSRNKKCVTLNLRNDNGRRLLLALLADADVLLENFRPGTLERWGLAPETLWEHNRGLIVARVSGFGQCGPGKDRAGYASVAEAIGGLRHLNGFADRPPPRTGISLGDSLAAMFATQGILTALYCRDARGGAGQVVDVSLVDSCFSLLESVVPEYAATGAVRGPSGTRLEGIAPSNLFQTNDGKWIVIAANQDTVFERLVLAMGEPGLAQDPRYKTHEDRGKNQEELEQRIAEWAMALPSECVTKILDESAVPCGIVHTAADIFADPLFEERQMLVHVEDPELGDIVMPGVIPKLSATPGSIEWSGPAMGQHNEEVFGGLLGLDDEEIEALRREGTL